MTNEVHEKDMVIEKNKQDLEVLKAELEKKDVEIREKDELIKGLEDDDVTTDESDEEDDILINKSVNKSKMIGSGHFGKQFEVRKGMEEEAESLRMEWRRNQKRK